MSEITFEWDVEKNKLNKKLHGIKFEDAKFVFNDPLKIILPDLYHREKEERWLAIDVIRIISARIATKAEVRLYNDKNKQT